MKLRSKSSLFLIELIIVILFFSIAGTVCIQLFVKSHLLSSKTQAMNHCVKYAQNYAEVFTNLNGSEDSFSDFFEDSLFNNGDHTYCINYDKSFKTTTDPEAAFYRCSLAFDYTNKDIPMISVNFYKISDDSLLYSLDVKKYAFNGGAHYEK